MKLRCSDPRTRKAYEYDTDDPESGWVPVKYTKADEAKAKEPFDPLEGMEWTGWGYRFKRPDVH